MQRTVTIITAIAITLLLLVSPLQVLADGTPALIIGLQTGSATNASSEFVRLANVTASGIDVTGWKVQYKSAAGTSWTTKATLSGSIAVGTTLLITTTEYQTDEAHQTMTSGLSQAGGHVQIIDKTNAQMDLLGWGTATAAQGSPAPSPQPGQTLQRVVDNQGNYQANGNNTDDFALDGEVAVPPKAAPSGSASAPVVLSDQTGLDSPEITELMPNPASPQTDAKDEFVELYNPNNVGFDLNGYKLQTGTTYNHSYVFPATILAPNAYQAFYAPDTKATLSNSDGKARLLDPSGNTLSETAPYESAPDGQSWSLGDDTWQWSTTPTPGAANIVTAKPSTASATASKSSTTKTTAKKATAKKATAASAKKPSSAAAATTGGTSPVDSNSPSPIHPLVLVGIVGAAVAYACYEYRRDIANRLHQLKRFLRFRRGNRAKV